MMDLYGIYYDVKVRGIVYVWCVMCGVYTKLLYYLLLKLYLNFYYNKNITQQAHSLKHLKMANDVLITRMVSEIFNFR